MYYGCRALLKTLHTYVTKHKLVTVQDIIHRWAPACENDTEPYVQHVASIIRRGPTEPLPFGVDQLLYLDIAKAIARHENGLDAERIDDEDWTLAFDRVFA